MMRSAFVGAVLASVMVGGAAAGEFPLTFKTIPAKDVMKFPGDYGAYGQLRLAKPDALRKEPKPISAQPLYGECEQVGSDNGVLIRLDESKGAGKGYDQLIVDVNRNGDLTDDAPVGLAKGTTEAKTSSRSRAPLLFGPIEGPAGKTIAGGRPLFFAQAYINPLPKLSNGQDLRNYYAGQLRLRAGWYLETTVDLEGHKQKVGVFDGESNLQLGDCSQPSTYENGKQKNWYFQNADNWLVDVDGSGGFEPDVFGSEARPMGAILYFGAQPYRVTLATGCQTLRVNPWTEPLAEVTLQPRGEQVRTLTLAWQQPGGKWQLLQPGVTQGKIKVPPGIYRLYECALFGAQSTREQVVVSGSQRVVKDPVTFTVGQANTLQCGAPLQVKVSGEKRVPPEWEPVARQAKGPADSDYVLRISANIAGAGTEIYSSFAKGEKFEGEPSRPKFTVADAGGREIGNGNLEFG